MDHFAAMMATMSAVSDLDRWLRTDFVAGNTVLEHAYFAAGAEIVYDVRALDQHKHAIRDAGGALVARIGELPDAAADRYVLLGAVGFYLAACRRHEVAAPEPAQALASRLGLSLGVAPRFVFAHQSIHNPAVGDEVRAFTDLPDERTFVLYNALGVLAYQRAAAALRRVPGMGVSSAFATYLLEDARTALDDVLRFNRALAAELDADRFFLNVRPYYKPHPVGDVEYRGANAGDFAAVNEIDLHLGLCDTTDPFYLHLLTEKYPYVPPEDQPHLRSTKADLLTAFENAERTPRLRVNAEHFLALCRAHGAAYAFHHHRLVKPFLERPAAAAPPERQARLSASGPPLDVVIAGLARLSDLRAARDRPGTAHARLARLRARLGS